MHSTMTYSEAEHILGLSGTYGADDLKKAYRKAIAKAHPDAGGSEEEAVRVNSAKEVIERRIAQSASGRVSTGSASTTYSRATSYGAGYGTYATGSRAAGSTGTPGAYSSKAWRDVRQNVYQNAWNKRDEEQYDAAWSSWSSFIDDFAEQMRQDEDAFRDWEERNAQWEQEVADIWEEQQRVAHETEKIRQDQERMRENLDDMASETSGTPSGASKTHTAQSGSGSGWQYSGGFWGGLARFIIFCVLEDGLFMFAVPGAFGPMNSMWDGFGNLIDVSITMFIMLLLVPVVFMLSGVIRNAVWWLGHTLLVKPLRRLRGMMTRWKTNRADAKAKWKAERDAERAAREASGERDIEKDDGEKAE